MISHLFWTGIDCLGDQSCQNFDRHRSLFVLQRFPDLGFRNEKVEKVQIALHDGGSPQEQTLRRGHQMWRGDGGERLLQRGREASRGRNRDEDSALRENPAWRNRGRSTRWE